MPAHVDRGEPRPRPSRRFGLGRQSRRVLVFGLSVALAGLALHALIGSADELVGAADLVGRPRPEWLALAIAAELASYVAYGSAQRVLLTRLGRRIGLGVLAPLALAAQAIGIALPGGYAWNNVYCFGILRRWGVDELPAGQVLLATSVLYTAALALLAVAGAEIAGSARVIDLRPLAYGVLAVLGVGTALAWWRRKDLRRLAMTGLDRLEQRAVRRGSSPARMRRWRDQVRRAVPLGPVCQVRAGGWLGGSWLADAGCLAAAFPATGGVPPWRGLLLAYCAGQLAAMLPITPGGLGVVEGSLTLAIVAYGGARLHTLAAVLLYRLISFWGVLPTGGACVLLLGRRRPPPGAGGA